MSADRLSGLRAALIRRGMDPEAVNDLVMAAGATGFARHAVAVEAAAVRAEARMQDPAVGVASCFRYELLLRLLGVDSTGPDPFDAAVERVHHLVDHAVADDCGFARLLARQDPLRILRDQG